LAGGQAFTYRAKHPPWKVPVVDTLNAVLELLGVNGRFIRLEDRHHLTPVMFAGLESFLAAARELRIPPAPP
jgi:hypothetical protein